MQTKTPIAIAMRNYGNDQVRYLIKRLWDSEENDLRFIQMHLYGCCGMVDEATIMRL
jgi:hypothetical protein